MHQPGVRGGPGEAERLQQQRVAELERRIRELERLDDASFGRFTRLDWWICVLGAVVAPLAALWWFAG